VWPAVPIRTIQGHPPNKSKSSQPHLCEPHRGSPKIPGGSPGDHSKGSPQVILQEMPQGGFPWGVPQGSPRGCAVCLQPPPLLLPLERVPLGGGPWGSLWGSAKGSPRGSSGRSPRGSPRGYPRGSPRGFTGEPRGDSLGNLAHRERTTNGFRCVRTTKLATSIGERQIVAPPYSHGPSQSPAGLQALP
jgi:hypothetical protein